MRDLFDQFKNKKWDWQPIIDEWKEAALPTLETKRLVMEDLERLKYKLTPKDLTQEEIDVVNEIKDKQREVAILWKELVTDLEVDCDMRQMNIAKTHLEEGFTAFVKAITKPEDPFALPKPDREM